MKQRDLDSRYRCRRRELLGDRLLAESPVLLVRHRRKRQALDKEGQDKGESRDADTDLPHHPERVGERSPDGGAQRLLPEKAARVSQDRCKLPRNPRGYSHVFDVRDGSNGPFGFAETARVRGRQVLAELVPEDRRPDRDPKDLSERPDEIDKGHLQQARQW